MKKTFKRIHLWLSVPFGIILSLICFTGALLVFEREVTELVHYDLYHLKEVKANALPISSLIDKVVPELKDSVSVTGITISNDANRPYRVNLSAPRKAGMMVNQYTGEVLGMDQRLPFFKTVLKLHRWLLCERPDNDEDIWWGKLIVGTSTLMFVLVLLSGIIAWWPKTTRGLSKQMKIHTRRGLKRLFLDLHTIGGVYVCLLLLVMALTGLTWSFDWYRNGFYSLFGVKPEKKEANAPKGDKPQSTAAKGASAPMAPEESEEEFVVVPPNYIVWQSIFEDVRNRQKDAATITIDDEEAEATLGTLGNSRAANVYAYDETTGKVTDVEHYADAKPKQKVRGWVYSVHTGSWGGLLTRILQFLAALFGATLPLTGYYLWIKRSLKKRTKK